MHLFSSFPLLVGFMGSLSGALSLFPSLFALWREVVLFFFFFFWRVLPVIVSLSVFVREVAFGQKRDGGKDWLVLVFWPLSFWSCVVSFFFCRCCCLADGSLHIRVECLVRFVFCGVPSVRDW